MKGRFDLPSLLFYGLSILMAVVCVICFVNALPWINKPFPGFLMYKLPRVASMNISEWSGVKAGLKLMDKVIEADKRPVSRGEDVVAIAREKPPGTPIRYTIESEGKIRNVSVSTEIFGIYDFIRVFLTPFVGGIILFCLGFAVYVLKPNVATSWVFFLACLFEGMYMATGFEIMSTYSVVYVHYTVVPIMMAPLFHFGLIFPEKKKIIIRHPWLEYLIYVPAILLAIAFELSLLTSTGVIASGWIGRMFDIKATTALTRTFTLLCVAGMLGLVIHSFLRTSSSIARQRARIIIFGVSLAFFPPGLIMALVYFVKAHFPWNFLAFFVLSYPASIAYSIVRHNLFDADTIIKRTVGYIVLTALVIGAYVLISLSLNVFLAQYQVAESKTFPIIFTLIIILVFNPLRNRIQSLVDKIFFRKDYDYGKILDKIGGAITSLLDLGAILRRMVGTFVEDMFIDTSSIMLLNPAKTEYKVYLAEGEKRNAIEGLSFKRHEPLIQVMEKEKKELTKYDVLEDPKYKAFCEDCSRNFESLHASLIVPLVFQDEVIGLINLGEKKSGKTYNREDIDLFRNMAKQGAVAIENARLADQMKVEEAARTNLARYLSPQIVDQIIKKDVQVNLGGDRKVVTVLFSDIRNFTRITETLPPDQLVQLLNEYFTEMAKIIFENQGSLDKYIGDAIVAVFGSLIPLGNPSKTAIQCAIEMMKRMVSLNETWKHQYGFTMEMGIGINTGEVFLGNIGSPERMEFTVIGDTVNIASRFSGIALGGQILITKETLSNLGPDMRYQELPPVEVKGKTGRLEVYEIVY